MKIKIFMLALCCLLNPYLYAQDAPKTQKLTDGYHIIQSLSNNYVLLEVNCAIKQDTCPVYLQKYYSDLPSINRDEHLWFLKKLNGNTFTLKAHKNSSYLAVGVACADNTKPVVTIQTQNGILPNQKWIVKKEGEYYIIKSNCSKVLTIQPQKEGYMSVGLQDYQAGNTAQLWIIKQSLRFDSMEWW